MKTTAASYTAALVSVDGPLTSLKLFVIAAVGSVDLTVQVSRARRGKRHLFYFEHPSTSLQLLFRLPGRPATNMLSRVNVAGCL